MTDTPQVLLAHHLKTLKLPTFLREYDKLARQCATEGACSAPGSLDTSLSHAAGLIEIAACHA